MCVDAVLTHCMLDNGSLLQSALDTLTTKIKVDLKTKDVHFSDILSHRDHNLQMTHTFSPCNKHLGSFTFGGIYTQIGQFYKTSTLVFKSRLENVLFKHF